MIYIHKALLAVILAAIPAAAMPGAAVDGDFTPVLAKH